MAYVYFVLLNPAFLMFLIKIIAMPVDVILQLPIADLLRCRISIIRKIRIQNNLKKGGVSETKIIHYFGSKINNV